MPFHSRNDLLVRTSDGRNFTLQEPLEFVLDAGMRYRVPVGAQTDGASTPAALWPILPPFGGYWLAAVLHDAAYRGTLEIMERDGGWAPAGLSREQADLLLLEAMIALDVPEATRFAIYEGVRAGGNRAFAEDRGQ